ncbi:MAG: hypothetical protein ABL929_11935 [Ferruginibacter sp.]
MADKKEITISKKIVLKIILCFLVGHLIIFIYQFKGYWSWTDLNAPVVGTQLGMKEMENYNNAQQEGTSKVLPKIVWRYECPTEGRYRVEFPVGSEKGMPKELDNSTKLKTYFNSSLKSIDYSFYIAVGLFLILFVASKFKLKLK